MPESKTVAEKARIKPGTRIAVLNPVVKVVDSLGLPDGCPIVAEAEAAIVMLFVNNRAELDALMPPAVEALPSGSVLWVYYRKGSRAAGLDMSRDDVWAIAERYAMRPVGLLGVDETWSVFRFKHGSGA
ncbi:MAG: hypothetical protein HGB10_09680 [Coriobacteriia bacterium]|nr:hypothetical protein [Coriobacteriia bacterium]